jgi:hypothetical protein
MMYAAHWARFWSLVGAVGVGFSFLVWEPLSVLSVFITASVCAGVLLAMVAPAPGPHSPLPAVRWSRIAARAALLGGGAVAVGAFSAVLPAAALPLVLAAVLSSPVCLDHVRRWRDTRRSAVGQTTQVPGTLDGRPAEESLDGAQEPPPWPGPTGCRLDVSPASAQELTDEELCREWRRSFVTLTSARSSRDLGLVVAQRQIYLDEMDRRSPSALQAWLASGARAAGGPDRFLTQRHDDQSDAA